ARPRRAAASRRGAADALRACAWADGCCSSSSAGPRWAGRRRHLRRAGRPSDFPDLSRLQALRALDDLEFHFLAFCQRAEAFLDDLGVMHEHVRSLLLQDEAEPLRIVEPLHFATCHLLLLTPCPWRGTPASACDGAAEPRVP